MNGFERVDTTSNRIRIAMKNIGKKQADVVRETGIDKGAMSNYVNGRYEPKQDAIYKIAKSLCVSEMWLWGYDCPMERPASQIENDELVDLIERLKNDKGFRRLVTQLNRLNPSKLESILNLLDIPD